MYNNGAISFSDKKQAIWFLKKTKEYFENEINKEDLLRSIIIATVGGRYGIAGDEIELLENDYDLNVSDRVAIWFLRYFLSHEELARNDLRDMGSYAEAFMTDEEESQYLKEKLERIGIKVDK